MKQLQHLQSDLGLPIHSVRGRGYRLESELSVLSEEAIRAGGVVWPIFLHEQVDSTNAEALRLLEADTDAPFLVLDDLGAEHVTDWVAEQLFRMINHRWMYRDELVTIVTSNLKPDALIRRIASKTGSSADGQRIVSRICEMCRLIEVQGDDYRMGRR